MNEPRYQLFYTDGMNHSRMMARGTANPVVLLFVLFPLSLTQLGIDAFHAVRAAQTDEYDYEAEVRRLAIEPMQGDEQRIQTAEAVWQDLDEAATMHSELLDGFHDPESDEGWYDTYYRHDALCNYDEYLAEVRSNYADSGADRLDEEVRRLNRQREWAKQLIDALPESGIIERLDRAANADRSIMPLLDAQMNLIAAANGQKHRSLFRCLDAAKQWARQSGDWDAHIEYHRLSLALARHWMQQPDTLAWIQGVAIYSGALNDIREQLTLGAIPAPVIRELMRVGLEQAVPESIDYILAEQRAESLGALDMYYSEGGIAYIEDGGNYFNLAALLLPRRSHAEMVINRFYQEFSEYAAMSTTDRLGAEKPVAWSYVRPKSLIGVILQMPIVAVMQTASITTRLVEVNESVELERLSLRLLMAIELFRAERGALPENLADLVPEYLDERPRDPFDPEGGLLRYRLLDAPDELGRPYILYSVGRDMADNGGHLEQDGWPKQALQDRYPGTDYIINFIEPSEGSE